MNTNKKLKHLKMLFDALFLVAITVLLCFYYQKNDILNIVGQPNSLLGSQFDKEPDLPINDKLRAMAYNTFCGSTFPLKQYDLFPSTAT